MCSTKYSVIHEWYPKYAHLMSPLIYPITKATYMRIILDSFNHSPSHIKHLLLVNVFNVISIKYLLKSFISLYHHYYSYNLSIHYLITEVIPN